TPPPPLFPYTTLFRSPIFPQQSIREMVRTGRSPDRVMGDAIAGMRQAGWTGRTGADADHLKTTQDVDATAAAGFTFFTIDPSERSEEHTSELQSRGHL